MRSLVFFAFLSACAITPVSVERKPSSALQNAGFRFGVKSLKDGNRLVVLGTHRPLGGENFYVYDFQKLGFVGDEISQLEPRFLLSVNANGIQDVFSFDLQIAPSPGLKFNEKKEVVWDRRWGVRYGIWNPMATEGFPPKLLETDFALQDLYLRAAVKLVLQISKLAPVPFSTVGTILNHFERAGASKSEVEAQYLQYIVTAVLEEEAFQGLAQVLGREELRRLGAQLAIRYNREWDFAGLGSPWDELEQLEQYDVIRNVRAGYSSQNLARLVRMANLQGFVVVPLGPYFAMILAAPDWDLESGRGQRQYNDRYLSIADDENAKINVKQSLKAATGSGKLVPMGIFALNQNTAPLQMIHFQDPLKWAHTERRRKILSLARDIGYSFIPSGEVTLALSAAGGVLKFIARKQGQTVFEYRVQASGELQAAFESGLVQIDTQSIVSEALVARLEDYGFSDHEIRRYRGLVASSDPKVVQQAVDEIIPQLASREERFGRLLAESPDDQRKRVFSKAVWTARMRNRMNDEGAMKRFERQLSARGQAAPKPREKAQPDILADAQEASFGQDAPRRPVIAFLVDGLRPDRLEEAMRSGQAPNLNEWFGKRGIHFESYSPRSITLPSWASALTGHDVDGHGLRSNSPSNRDFDGVFTENLIDWRKDVFFPKYWEDGRSFRHIQESGVNWLPRYYNSDEVLVSYMPINDRAYPPLGFLASQAARSLGKFLMDTSDSSVLLDQAQTRKLVQGIQSNAKGVRENNRKPLQLVAIWLSSVDHLSHYNSRRLDEAVREVDSSVGRILKEASLHPTLKDAFVVLVSDHGHIGGPESANPHRHHSTPKAHYLDNTQLNLVHYFAGSYKDRPDYRFNVGTAESPEPDFDLGFLKEFLIQPFRYTFPFKDKPRDVLIDSSGDSVAQVYLKPSLGMSRPGRMSFWDLQNYTYLSSQDDKRRTHAIVTDLLEMQLQNLESPKLASEIRAQSQEGRPVHLAALPLDREVVQKSLVSLGDEAVALPWTRDPVLVVSRARTGLKNYGLILTSDSPTNTLFFYTPLKDVEFESDGRVRAVRGGEDDDPTGILQILRQSDEQNLWAWRNERDWIRILKNHPQPTLVSSLARSLTLMDPARRLEARQQETPDLLITAHWGFNFNSSSELHSDHGGFFVEETKNTFIISRLGRRAPARRHEVKGPVLIKDLAPTVLDLAGLPSDTGLQGRSLKPQAEAAVLSAPEPNDKEPRSPASTRKARPPMFEEWEH